MGNATGSMKRMIISGNRGNKYKEIKLVARLTIKCLMIEGAYGFGSRHPSGQSTEVNILGYRLLFRGRIAFSNVVV